MTLLSPALQQLIDALRTLPGIGPKGAQRLAFHILERARPAARTLAAALQTAVDQVDHCQQCRMLCETDICPICSNPRRQTQQLCIVESPADILAIEHASIYQGRYFVLMGHLSPIDGIGPDELGISLLLDRVQTDTALTEIILATNPTAEGEATALYLSEQLRAHAPQLRCSRIAHGVPMGGELEYLDGRTLAQALQDRRVFEG